MKTYASDTLTASAQVGQKNAAYHGYVVTVVTATAAINIRKNSLTGQIIDVIPIGTVAGASKSYSYPIGMDTGLFVDFNGGSGSVVVLYE